MGAVKARRRVKLYAATVTDMILQSVRNEMGFWQVLGFLRFGGSCVPSLAQTGVIGVVARIADLADTFQPGDSSFR